MRKLSLLNFIPLIMTTPAIIIGAITMYYNKISIFIWIQNIICLIIAGLISYFVLSSNFNMKKSYFNSISILISLFFLILTFMSSGMNGVHRWISIGIVKLNVSMIVLPIIIIGLWEILKIKIWWFPIFITMLISILLTIQPDASQLTAFAIPMIVMLCNKIDKNILYYQYPLYCFHKITLNYLQYV